ncbi:uncharacterized protein LOC120358261 [Solenopsis invicta]|uniref:uncharacterized protein LOC120358261 n=1 Tax=Solenopsis invicta TaxID=13686 RepID=UPI00193E3614|nr:uncharacterized protein LOC120358261 [Solenopsis invicta]
MRSWNIKAADCSLQKIFTTKQIRTRSRTLRESATLSRAHQHEVFVFIIRGTPRVRGSAFKQRKRDGANCHQISRIARAFVATNSIDHFVMENRGPRVELLIED